MFGENMVNGLFYFQYLFSLNIYIRRLPLYTTQDAENCLKQFTSQKYGRSINLADGLRVKFRDAGHILGSAFAEFKVTQGVTIRKILFSGDIGGPNRPILNDPVQVREVDYLVVESTYGNRLHGDKQSNREEELAKAINECVERNGVMVIPAFAVGRTQELLFHIRELENSSGMIDIVIQNMRENERYIEGYARELSYRREGETIYKFIEREQ